MGFRDIYRRIDKRLGGILPGGVPKGEGKKTPSSKSSSPKSKSSSPKGGIVISGGKKTPSKQSSRGRKRGGGGVSVTVVSSKGSSSKKSPKPKGGVSVTVVSKGGAGSSESSQKKQKAIRQELTKQSKATKQEQIRRFQGPIRKSTDPEVFYRTGRSQRKKPKSPTVTKFKPEENRKAFEKTKLMGYGRSAKEVFRKTKKLTKKLVLGRDISKEELNVFDPLKYAGKRKGQQKVTFTEPLFGTRTSEYPTGLKTTETTLFELQRESEIKRGVPPSIAGSSTLIKQQTIAEEVSKEVFKKYQRKVNRKELEVDQAQELAKKEFNEKFSRRIDKLPKENLKLYRTGGERIYSGARETAKFLVFTAAAETPVGAGIIGATAFSGAGALSVRGGEKIKKGKFKEGIKDIGLAGFSAGIGSLVLRGGLGPQGKLARSIEKEELNILSKKKFSFIQKNYYISEEGVFVKSLLGRSTREAEERIFLNIPIKTTSKKGGLVELGVAGGRGSRTVKLNRWGQKGIVTSQESKIVVEETFGLTAKGTAKKVKGNIVDKETGLSSKIIATQSNINRADIIVKSREVIELAPKERFFLKRSFFDKLAGRKPKVLTPSSDLKYLEEINTVGRSAGLAFKRGDYDLIVGGRVVKKRIYKPVYEKNIILVSGELKIPLNIKASPTKEVFKVEEIGIGTKGTDYVFFEKQKYSPIKIEGGEPSEIQKLSLQKLKQNQKSVKTKGTEESKSFGDILSVKTAANLKPSSNLIHKKPITNPVILPFPGGQILENTSPLVISHPKLEKKGGTTVTKPTTKQRSRSILDVSTKPTTKQRSRSILDVSTRSKTKQETKQELAKSLFAPAPHGPFEFYPKIPKPKKPILVGGRIKRKSAESSGERFSVSIRRRGKFRTIAMGLNLRQAFGVGRERVGTTLAATFKVTPERKGQRATLPTSLRGFRTKRGKKEGILFIEKRSQRLSTPSEVKEIGAAKLSVGKIHI